MVKINGKVLASETPLIKLIAAETNALLAAGAPIVNLSQGCPNLPMFEEAYEATKAALDSRRLSYTAVPGKAEVRQTCARFVNELVLGGDQEPVYKPEHICITNGAVQVSQ